LDFSLWRAEANDSGQVAPRGLSASSRSELQAGGKLIRQRQQIFHHLVMAKIQVDYSHGTRW
jgi:hypothetical protein